MWKTSWEASLEIDRLTPQLLINLISIWIKQKWAGWSWKRNTSLSLYISRKKWPNEVDFFGKSEFFSIFLGFNRVFVISPVSFGTQFFDKGEKSKTMQNKSKLPSKYSNSRQFNPISTNIQEFIDRNVLKNIIFEQNFLKFQSDEGT